jgi:hypothetical protein
VAGNVPSERPTFPASTGILARINILIVVSLLVPGSYLVDSDLQS